MKRIPEPELMDDEEQVHAYAKANFEDAHRNFITLFQATFGQKDLCGYVLDLGCGHGDITIRFARTYPKCTVHGIDGSEAMIRCGNGILKEAHDIQDRVVLIRGMLPDVVPPHRKYDIIISNSLLHHLGTPQLRALKPTTRMGFPEATNQLYKALAGCSKRSRCKASRSEE